MKAGLSILLAISNDCMMSGSRISFPRFFYKHEESKGAAFITKSGFNGIGVFWGDSRTVVKYECIYVKKCGNKKVEKNLKKLLTNL